MVSRGWLGLAVFGMAGWGWGEGRACPLPPPAPVAIASAQQDADGPAAIEVHPDTGRSTAGPDAVSGEASCRAGCSAPDVAPRSTPSPLELERLLRRFATSPDGSEADALDELLFHRDSTLEALEALESADLDWRDPTRRTLLTRELGRTHAWVALRIVDEDGVVRAEVDPRRVPLGKKRHLHPGQSAGLRDPEFSGRVERVGLKQLWARY